MARKTTRTTRATRATRTSRTARGDETERLQGVADGLGRALKDLRSFLHKSRRLSACESAAQVLEASDELLLEAVDFLYYRFYLTGTLAIAEGLPGREEGPGPMRLVRAACPEDLPVDWDLISWAMSSRDVMLLPSASEETGGARSLIVVPLLGHASQLGAVLLWVEFDERGFTEHTADLLGVYGRSLSSALDGLELGTQRARAQALVQKVLESVPLGIFSLDRGGALTFINGTAEFMLGRPRHEVLWLECGRAFIPEVAALARRLIGRLERSEDPGEEQLEFAAGGARYFLGMTATRLVLPGSPEAAGHVFVVRDLQVTREVQRLREIDAMKDDLLSLVSHELRTPLASIMAYAEALLMEGMVDTEAERREYLEVIRTEGDRLGRLINDVLDLTKMQAGKMDYSFAEQDIRDVVRHAISVEQKLAEKKKVSLSFEPAAEMPAVRLDRDRIIQVVCNLLSNAIKYTDEGGSVGVYAEPATDGDRGQKQVEVRVKDTGLGIPPEQVHKVWSRFEQVENVRHHTGGTGLGMPICRQIIEEGHGGKIWLESEVGKGTTVFFRLPVG
jgi:signal transduction histidine kinase